MNHAHLLAATFMLEAATGIGCMLPQDVSGDEPVSASQDQLEIYNQSYKVLGFLVESLGHGLNGTAMNGTTLDGHVVLYASLSGVQWQGRPVVDVSLDASSFVGKVDDSRRIRATAFEGASFPAVLDDGTEIRLTAESIAWDADLSNKDVLLHWLTYPAQDGPHPLCGVDASGQPVPAIALSGRPDTRVGEPGGGGWIDDPGVATFACAGFVLAKCVELGYKPWRTGKICTHGAGCQTVSLAGHHRACTRMLRADYCGNGESHSRDGVLIGLYDAFGIRIDAEDWPVEAEWAADGARCAMRPRVPALPLPSCWPQLQAPACGELASFNDGALIISELSP